jgi:predicted secreted acid phosphatase
MKQFLRTILAIAREIADENAYQRHLVQHDRPHSADEWRKFSDQRFARKYARAKCC